MPLKTQTAPVRRVDGFGGQAKDLGPIRARATAHRREKRHFGAIGEMVMVKGELFVDRGQRHRQVVGGGRIAGAQLLAQPGDGSDALVQLERQRARADDIAQRGEEKHGDAHAFGHSSAR